MLFSVIIPVYNVAPYLRECLDSLFAQTYADWEAICVDDGSTDESGVICDEYAKKDLRFRVIHQKNAGVGVARNAGLKVATGEWIMFLDADDVLSHRALGAISKIIAENLQANLIRFDYKYFQDNSIPDLNNELCTVQSKIDISKRIRREDWYVYLWQFVFRKELIKGVLFKHYKHGEDRVFIVDILCNRAMYYIAINAVCYYYRQRDGSAMHSFQTIQILCDEMDHILDIAEIMDKCGKEVKYANENCIEGYIKNCMPAIMMQREYLDNFDELHMLWRKRLFRARNLKGFSRAANKFFFLHTNWLFRDITDWYMFFIIKMKYWYSHHYNSLYIKFYRKLLRRGEYRNG